MSIGSKSQVIIKVISEETRRQLTAIEKEQFPFALAKTLTDVANMAVIAVQKRTRQEYDLKTEFIPKGIGRTVAKKKDIKTTGVGTTVIYTKPIISGWMPIHEVGGQRKPVASGSGDKGVSLTIPAQDLLKRAYMTSTGAVKKQYKAKVLLLNYKMRNVSHSGGLIRHSVGGRKGKAFIIRGKGSNVGMIVRRKGKRRYPLEILYIFSRRARYRPTWRFEKTVEHIVDRRFEMMLKVNLRKAVRSAR
jgi:hypothetical protein